MRFLCLAYYDEKKFEASKHPTARPNGHLGWGIEIRPIEMCPVQVATAR